MGTAWQPPKLQCRSLGGDGPGLEDAAQIICAEESRTVLPGHSDPPLLMVWLKHQRLWFQPDGLLAEICVLQILSILDKAARVSTSSSSSEPQKKSKMPFMTASRRST